MIQMTLVRHAAAEPTAPGASDHDRVLSDRGRREAVDVARRVLRAGVRPGTILCSTATRARETAQLFADAMGADIVERRDLYDADAADLLRIAREWGEDEILVVAHDPGMSALSSELAGRDVPMPPGTATVFTWHESGWESVGSAPPDDVARVTPA